METVSKCCGQPVSVENDGRNGQTWEGTTFWYECQGCEKPCDVEVAPGSTIREGDI